MKNRIQYLDIAKLIGLALVCFCHIPIPEGNFHVWVYSFHMPLFFILSGMFFKPESGSIKANTKQLLIPFVAFNIIVILFTVCLNLLLTNTVIFPENILSDLLKSKYIIGPSWFLLSLFCIRVFCGKLFSYLRIQELWAVCILLLFIFYLTKDCMLWDILSLGSTLLGLPFYVLGFSYKDYALNHINDGGVMVTLAILGLSCLSIFNGLVGMYEHSFGISLFGFYFLGTLGTIAIVRLSLHLRIPSLILDTFMQGAVFYICMHTLMFNYMLLFGNKITGDFSGNTIIEKIIVTIFTFIVSYPIIRFMLRYTPILLGKQLKK